MALLTDQSEPLIQDKGPPPAAFDPALLTQAKLAVAEAALELGSGSPPPWKAFARSLPIYTHHDSASAPAWAAGRARAKTAGPFVDHRGFEFWVDSYEPVSYLQVFRAHGGPPFLMIPAESDAPGAQRSELIAGTVWIRASEFAAAAPGGYVGLRILGGLVELDGPVEDPQVSFTLTLDLDHPAQGGLGATRATLPSSATIHIAPSGVDAVEMADASIELDGGTFVLAQSGELPRYEPALNSILVSLTSQPGRLTIENPESPLYALTGSANVEAGVWTLPVTEAGAESLGEAFGAGALALIVGPGLTATWRALAGGPARLKSAFIEMSPGLLAVVAPGAETRRSRHHFLLWRQAGAANAPRSSLEATFEKPHTVKFLRSQEGVDAVLAWANVAAHFNQPLHADGSRPAFRAAGATLRMFEDHTGATLQVSAMVPPLFGAVARPVRLSPLALSNALLRTTPAQTLSLAGRLDPESSVAAGTVVLGYGLYGLLPILPDPYTSNAHVLRLDTRATPPAALVASLAWIGGAAPELAVSAVPLPAQGIMQGRGLRDLLPPPLAAASARPDDPETGRLREIFDETLGLAARGALVLLDVSTHADQLGVDMAFRSQRVQGSPEIAIRGLDLAAPGLNLRVFMLPQVQWEPVVTPLNPAAPFPEKLFSVNDGGPGLIGANSVNLVPVAPIPVAEELLHAIRDPQRNGAVLFTLPFGIKAVVRIIAERLGQFGFLETVRLLSNRPEFGPLLSARQFRLEPGGVIASEGMSLPGAAIQTRNAIDQSGPGRFSVLDNRPSNNVGTTRDTFNNTFGPDGVHPGVPVSRVDLSGYGESCFSLWTDKHSPPPKISEVRFDVMIGRTAYEVVQEMSILWPWQAIVVRTITMERRANARVLRFDSGWVAATPGVFRVPGFPDVCHPGVIKGLYNIGGIREIISGIRPPGAPGTLFTSVRFDADAAIENVVAGQRVKGLDENGEPVQFVPVQQMLGFVQRLPLAKLLTPAELAALFADQGPIGVPIDCEIDVGGSGLRMRVSGVFADAAGPADFAVAAHGMPILPANGQWSLTRTANAQNGADENEAQPVDRNAAVPLIRRGTATLANAQNGEPYRFADPADLLMPAPAFDYGLLFATEVFRVLFPRPRIEVDANRVAKKQISSEVQPLLADPYAVISTASQFPKGKHCIRFPTPIKPSLDILPGNHLRLSPVKFKVEPFRVREQVKTSNWRMALEYADETGARLTTVELTLDSTSTPPATMTMSPLNIVVDRDPFIGLMRIVGDLEVKSPAALAGASVVLGSVLSPVQAIITVLQDLQLPFALAAAIVASDDKSLMWKNNFHLNVVELLRKLLPGPHNDDDRIDLGFCKFRGEINIGMFISLCGKHKAGVFFELIGEFQQNVFIKLYAGGYFRLELAFEVEAEAEEGKPAAIKEVTKIEFAAAAAASIGGEIIPHILKGEANVRYGYLIELDLGTGKIRPGVIVGMEVEAEVLSGAISVGFEWEGKALMTRHEEKIEIKAEITAAATATLAWAIETTIEIEGEFEFRVDEKIVAGLLVALGIVPI